MKVYYAHAICTYGSKQEKEEISHIMKEFPDCSVVDPGPYENTPEKRNDGMEFCKKLIDGCDSLVFSRLLGKISAGVGIEINHALAQNKPVYELKDGGMISIKKPVKYVSRDYTIKLYEKWRMQNHRHFMPPA